MEAMDFTGRSPYPLVGGWGASGLPAGDCALMPPWHSPWGPGVGALLLCPGGFSWESWAGLGGRRGQQAPVLRP